MAGRPSPHRVPLVRAFLAAALGVAALLPAPRAPLARPPLPVARWQPAIPRTWDDEAVRTLELPLPDSAASPRHVSADYYYRIPVRPMYRTYPIYAPGREPAGYLDSLKQRAPEFVFDEATLTTPAAWRRAGEVVFDQPIEFADEQSTLFAEVRDPEWYTRNGVAVTRDGILPNFTWVVRERGKIEVGVLACASCHTRVTPEGVAVKGAQGNFPDDRTFGDEIRRGAAHEPDSAAALAGVRADVRRFYAAPWLPADPNARTESLDVATITSLMMAIPPGVCARQGSSLYYPPRIPDLFGVKNRLYLDATGRVRHRDTADLMRYAALNQGLDYLADFGGWRPRGELPAPETQGRYSDAQLYALALYLEALDSPPSPWPYDVRAARGRKVFEREACGRCHTPPLYTNNRLVPADDFEVPEWHRREFHVNRERVGTDARLTLASRRGSGYYKVPSLRHVWLRGPLTHNGAVATLEDWFDPRRLRDDYEPTGFLLDGRPRQAVPGHPFGLDLTPDDRAALIAFLRTL